MTHVAGVFCVEVLAIGVTMAMDQVMVVMVVVMVLEGVVGALDLEVAGRVVVEDGHGVVHLDPVVVQAAEQHQGLVALQGVDLIDLGVETVITHLNSV